MSDKTLATRSHTSQDASMNKDTQLAIRFGTVQLDRIDAYRLRRGIRRSQAIRELVDRGLDVDRNETAQR